MLSPPANPRLAPWLAEPRQLWSTLDMIEFYGPNWFFTYISLAEISKTVRGIGTPGNPAPVWTRVGPEGELSENERNYIRHLIDAFVIACDGLGMRSTALAARMVHQYVDPLSDASPPAVYAALDGMLAQASKELGEQKFIFVPPEAHKYVTETHVFVPDMKPLPSSFPSADPHLWDAGNAHAVGLHTACVYYLMCAAEIGLRAFARHLRVKLHKTKGPIDWAMWEDILTAIGNKVEERARGAKKPKPVKASDRAFYRGVLAEFQGFKDIYRNDVMHVRVRYGPAEAVVALEKVNSFMRRLGERVQE